MVYPVLKPSSASFISTKLLIAPDNDTVDVACKEKCYFTHD